VLQDTSQSRSANLHLSVIGEVRAQLRERGIIVAAHFRAQHLMMCDRQPCFLPAAVRSRCSVCPCAVQAQHLVDEGGARAEQFGDLRDGVLATQSGFKHSLS
jgi:hypothetical protein